MLIGKTFSQINFILFSEPFRIKFVQSGLCWDATEDNQMVLPKSKCRDVWLLDSNSKLINVARDEGVWFSGTYKNLKVQNVDNRLVILLNIYLIIFFLILPYPPYEFFFELWALKKSSGTRRITV